MSSRSSSRPAVSRSTCLPARPRSRPSSATIYTTAAARCRRSGDLGLHSAYPHFMLTGTSGARSTSSTGTDSRSTSLVSNRAGRQNPIPALSTGIRGDFQTRPVLQARCSGVASGSTSGSIHTSRQTHRSIARSSHTRARTPSGTAWCQTCGCGSRVRATAAISSKRIWQSVSRATRWMRLTASMAGSGRMSHASPPVSVVNRCARSSDSSSSD